MTKLLQPYLPSYPLQGVNSIQIISFYLGVSYDRLTAPPTNENHFQDKLS